MKENTNQRLWNRQFIMLCLVNFFVSISYSMVSTTLASYVSNMGFAIAMAGTITGAFSVASMVTRPFTGVFSDRMDRRLLLIIATLAMGACTFLYGISTSFAFLMAVRLLHGVAFAFSSTVNMAAIPCLVPEKRMGEGISYFGVIQSIGIAIGPSVGIAIFSNFGYAANFSAAALIAVAAGFLACVILPMPAGGKKSHRFGIRDIIAKECLIYMVVDIAIASANGLENSLIALYGAQQNIANIGWYFTISAIVLCVTRVALGRIADQKGIAYALYPGLLLIVAGFLILKDAHSPAYFAAAAVIKTLGVGLARPAIQAACLKAVPPERRGSASSTYYIGSDIGQGTSPAVGGWIVDRTGVQNYGAAFAWYTIPLVLGGLLFAYYEKLKKARKTA